MSERQPATPVRPEKAWVFYPILLLLVVVTAKHPRRKPNAETVVDSKSGSEEVFRAFVSKLAFICCYEPCGSTVSACTVLRLPSCVQYVFAFNDQSRERLNRIHDGIKRILGRFQEKLPTTEAGMAVHRRSILADVILFNHDRVRSYLRSLRDHIQNCIAACQRDPKEESQAVETVLRDVQGLVQECLTYNGATNKEKVRPTATVSLIEMLRGLEGSDVFSTIRNFETREEQMASSTDWANLIHVRGRLLSYNQAITLAFAVGGKWPELFEDPEICMVPSSSKLPKALKKYPLKAGQIMRKTTGDADQLEKFSNILQQLSAKGIDIDGSIAEEWDRAGSPIVHAEMLVHDWLEKTGGTRPERFFNHYKFIGTSKPPCKLCAYFFEIYPTDVQVRPSHRNVFFPWRMPDISDTPDKDVFRKHQDTFFKIKDRIGHDIERTLSESLADGRPHDSSAYTTIVVAPRPPVEVALPRTVVESLAAMSISASAGRPSRPELPPASVEVAGASDENDEEVLLFRGRLSRPVVI